MTFKHVKFEDSPVMRSLEKVAQQKGMIKADPIEKTAAVKKTTTSLVPSTSLLDNVVRLCAGLRERGFQKQAADVEAHFAQYKQAQTLYETHKEKGEDVIEFAHPEGSHKLENVDADEAVFEDILDQMSKTLEKVEKKPTGKLTESQKAIEAVKVILGATPLDLNALYAQAEDALEKYRSVASTIAMRMGESADYNAEYMDAVKNVLDGRRVHAAGGAFGRRPFSEVLLAAIGDMKSGLEPSYFNPFGLGGPSSWDPKEEAAWKEVEKFWPVLKKYADRFQSVVSQIESIEGGKASQEASQEATKEISEVDPESAADAAASKLQGLIATINADIGKIQDKKLPNAASLVAWLNKARDQFAAKALQDLMGSDKSEQATAAAQKQYESLQSKVSAFEQRWLA